MTIDRLLVLLLSLSFLLLAPPAAAHDAAQMPGLAVLVEQKGPQPAPDPLSPDDTGLFLLSAAPEAPAPAGTDDGNGHDGVAAPAIASLQCLSRTGSDTAPAGAVRAGQACIRPWSTGPPRA